MVKDVVDGEVVGEEGPDQGKSGGGYGDEAGDAGAAGGLTDAFRGDGQGSSVSDRPERERSGEKGIDGQNNARKRETVPNNGMGWGMNVHFLR